MFPLYILYHIKYRYIILILYMISNIHIIQCNYCIIYVCHYIATPRKCGFSCRLHTWITHIEGFTPRVRVHQALRDQGLLALFRPPLLHCCPPLVIQDGPGRRRGMQWNYGTNAPVPWFYQEVSNLELLNIVIWFWILFTIFTSCWFTESYAYHFGRHIACPEH